MNINNENKKDRVLRGGSDTTISKKGARLPGWNGGRSKLMISIIVLGTWGYGVSGKWRIIDARQR